MRHTKRISGSTERLEEFKELHRRIGVLDMAKCKKCGNKMLTVSAYIPEMEADDEPYESGKKEEANNIFPEAMLNAEYCETCHEFNWVVFEVPMSESEQGVKQ